MLVFSFMRGIDTKIFSHCYIFWGIFVFYWCFLKHYKSGCCHCYYFAYGAQFPPKILVKFSQTAWRPISTISSCDYKQSFKRQGQWLIGGGIIPPHLNLNQLTSYSHSLCSTGISKCIKVQLLLQMPISTKLTYDIFHCHMRHSSYNSQLIRK